MRKSSAILLACWAIAVSAQAQGFKFSDPQPGAAAEAAAEARRQDTIDDQLATPCRNRIKNRKILVLIGEERNGLSMPAREISAAMSTPSTNGCSAWA